MSALIQETDCNRFDVSICFVCVCVPMCVCFVMIPLDSVNMPELAQFWHITACLQGSCRLILCVCVINDLFYFLAFLCYGPLDLYLVDTTYF